MSHIYKRREWYMNPQVPSHLLTLTITKSTDLILSIPLNYFETIIHAVNLFINILESVKDKYCLSPIFSAVSDHNAVPLNYSLTKTFESGFCCFGGIKPFYRDALEKVQRVGGNDIWARISPASQLLKGEEVILLVFPDLIA